MRLVSLETHPEVIHCDPCHEIGRFVLADVATEVDLDLRGEVLHSAIVGGLCGNHAEVLDPDELLKGPVPLPRGDVEVAG